jgi:hypothetical protein
MRLPQTARDVREEILQSSEKSKVLGDLRIRQLINILPKIDSEIVLEGVIQVFEVRNGSDRFSEDQEFAGKVLELINPKSKRNPKEILLRVLKNWDKSVEQFPFWLKNNYGIDKLTETFKELELTQIERDKLKTIKWWLQMNDGKYTGQ